MAVVTAAASALAFAYIAHDDLGLSPQTICIPAVVGACVMSQLPKACSPPPLPSINSTENHYAAGADGEADERADCQALFAVQDQHVETLITVPATPNAGLLAKASVVRAKFMVERGRVHPSIAVSLANDLVGGAVVATLVEALGNLGA
jgi:hypothetical protein